METVSEVLNRVIIKLSYGNCTPEEQQQIALQINSARVEARELERSAARARKMELTLDEIAEGARQDQRLADEIAEAREVAIRTGGNIRPLPVMRVVAR